MIKIHHLNCLKIVTPINSNVIGHCLLVEEGQKLALIETGIGLLDTQFPNERIGQELIKMVGFQFNENWTAYKQIQQLGLDPARVKHCIVSHLDPDHIGGLADFPQATLHVGKEEYEHFTTGNNRYLPIQLAHHPDVKTYSKTTETWFGLEARKIDVGFSSTLNFIPLFGHTLGHCGIAIEQQDKWLFYTGDAYYLRVELTDPSHPVNQLASMRAEDNELRVKSLDKIKKLIAENKDIEIFGYHDIEELNKFVIK